MGLSIERESFSATEFARFNERLTESMAVLRALLARPDFGHGEPSIGAEIELHLVDTSAAPLAINAEVLASANDPRLTLEINRFNLEVNASPVPLRGRPFASLRRELTDALAVVQRAAGQHGARAVMVGILPTLRLAHLAEGVLSDAPRYRALSRTLRDMRGAPFAVSIKGRESLSAQCDDVALEGANASLQVHLRVEPALFTRAFNAAQLAAAPVLAACCNSPFFDAKGLWDETRIALFQQSVDTRLDARERARMPSRVSFGYGWQRDPSGQFAENVALHPALLPVCGDRDVAAALEQAQVPRLEELRLHHGTVWNWNRAVFDPDHGGHLRIEHRLLPSGPTLVDMLANAALTLGLTLGLSADMETVASIFPFAYAEQNLYLAARHGLSAELSWPSERAPSPRPKKARDLVLELLPIAEAGLVRAGVAADEAHELLGVVRERVELGRTGAAVQREFVDRHEAEHGTGRKDALRALVEWYLDWSQRDVPIHRWTTSGSAV
jgi:gamma-glutamyl:cysteine ligase YbdK (ATP-grasp superfamily)